MLLKGALNGVNLGAALRVLRIDPICVAISPRLPGDERAAIQGEVYEIILGTPTPRSVRLRYNGAGYSRQHSLHGSAGDDEVAYFDSRERAAVIPEIARSHLMANDLVERPGTKRIPRRRARNSLRGRRGHDGRWAAPTRC